MHQRYHAFHDSTVAPSSPHNTHSQPNSAHTRPLRSSQTTFPSLVNPHHSLNSNTSLATRTRHHAFYARSLYTHWLPVFPPTPIATLASTKQLPAEYPTNRSTGGFEPFQFRSVSKDAADPLSMFLAAASERKGKECGMAGCRAARGRCPSLHCPFLKATRRE